MSIEATAEALAPETAMPVEAPVIEATETDEDSELDAIFDGMQEKDDQTSNEPTEAKTDEPETPKEPDGAEKPKETVAEVVEAPSDVPYQVKQHWKEIPESAQTAILESQREMARKLADQGRQVQGIAPIRDVLSKAVKDIPSMAGMQPEQAAEQIFAPAKLSNDFTSKPVETLLGYIKEHKLTDAMSQALSGQEAGTPQTVTLQNEINRLTRGLEQVSNPEYIRSQVSQFTQENTVQSEVQSFSSTADHWAAVEAHIPDAINFVRGRLGAEASVTDILPAAYDLAVSQYVPDAKAKQEVATNEAATTADPERSKAALQAKSVNVKSRSSGKARTLSEDEMLDAVYDKLQS